MQQVAAGPRAIKNWLKYHVPVFQRLRGISMHHPPFPATYGREVAAAYDAVRVAAIGLALTTIARTNIPGAIAELGVHGVWVNGAQVFDGARHVGAGGGPGQILRRFDS